VDEQTTTPTKTTLDAQTAENAPTAEVVSQATPLPTPEEPSQQFMMKLQIRRRP